MFSDHFVESIQNFIGRKPRHFASKPLDLTKKLGNVVRDFFFPRDRHGIHILIIYTVLKMKDSSFIQFQSLFSTNSLWWDNLSAKSTFCPNFLHNEPIRKLEDALCSLIQSLQLLFLSLLCTFCVELSRNDVRLDLKTGLRRKAWKTGNWAWAVPEMPFFLSHSLIRHSNHKKTNTCIWTRMKRTLIWDQNHNYMFSGSHAA